MNNGKKLKYNPVSKEFQDSAKELGLTGYQYYCKLVKEGKIVNPVDVNYNKVERMPKHYNPTNTCDECRDKLVPGKVCREYDKEGNWTKRWLCKKCGEKNNPNSQHNIIKLMRKFRNKQLGKNTKRGKGFRAEQGILITLGLENCNITKNDFNYKIDSYCHEIYGRIQIKSSALIGDGIKYYEWTFGDIKLENCDTVFLACMDKKYKKYMRMYRIPYRDIRIKQIRINPNTELKWEWNKFRIDEKPFNDIYQNLTIEDCSVLKDDDSND